MTLAESVKEYHRILMEMREEFPDFDILPKAGSRMMKTLDVLLRIITFGMMRTFMTDFTTTLGDSMYVTASWDDLHPLLKCITLRHERVHMRQKKRYFRTIPWLSFTIYGFKYCMWILPAGLAMARKLYEQEAYEETMRARAEYFGVYELRDVRLRKYIVDHFLSANYFWTWPYRSAVEAWYDDTVREIRFDMKAN